MDSYRQDQGNLFDLLTDDLLFVIFGKVLDAKSLCICMTLCKRFEALVPQTSSVHLSIPPRSGLLPAGGEAQPSSHPNATVKGFLSKIILNPIKFFVKNIVHRKRPCSLCDAGEITLRPPDEMLRSFNRIRSLVVQLPSHGSDISSNIGGPLLKWKAEFGESIRSCVVLGATSFRRPDDDNGREGAVKDPEVVETPSTLTNEELKLRVVWTISSLIAASARHHLLKRIVSQHWTVEDAVISDEIGQGRISMGEGQVKELRSLAGSERGSKVPALRMKMWYVPALELPESGCAMEGATLVVVTPAEEKGRSADGNDVGLAVEAFGDEWGGEGGFLREAVGRMVKKRKACKLEMNAF